jgi:hypothetical protein
VTRWEVDAELEALRSSAAQVQDSLLERANGMSSLAAPLSLAVELLEGRTDTVPINGFR